MMSEQNVQTATIAGGCFWCLEAPYQRVPGVISAISGYMGGEIENPTYAQVCSGTTGHAEVVQVTFNPDKISFEEILDIFFILHDPTQLNRQGNDTGTQYRSAIFPHNDEQLQQAKAKIDALNQEGEYTLEIVTTIEPLATFYRAEDYHQDYYDTNPHQSYCQVIVAPKLEKLKRYLQGK
ncbi:peptide-methionine (S)-S-oxide reductase MsrA [Thalassotalea sp. PS06]|uniref:peptide-methionine (S)-S-oxide reductase MsrA n=1 Tax=Thalassotalea sp. PS06 TaxID=2594005 RepID=UPI00116225C4|nr:peptide-methionine (S)-S-oxide reductase MsrA [Thalassotalea sp. PS06]QDP00471.1 peptide-methionine (S)-S-oxide reductase MsrA [Thalassotalea sp. PS06]